MTSRQANVGPRLGRSVKKVSKLRPQDLGDVAECAKGVNPPAKGPQFVTDAWVSQMVRERHPDLWFPVGDDQQRLEMEIAAVIYCNQCEVREVCLEIALETTDQYGVQGGMTEEQRRKLKQKGVA